MVLHRPRASSLSLADNAVSRSYFGSDAVCADPSVADKEGTVEQTATTVSVHTTSCLPTSSSQIGEPVG